MLALLVAAAFTACEDPGVLQPDTEQAAEIAAVDGAANADAGCDLEVPTDHATVQGAVNAAAPGDRVCVEAGGGPYREQVVVNKDLTLQGVNGPVIEAPDDPGDFTIPESGSTWEPIVFAHGGNASAGDVIGSGVVEVDVDDFTIPESGATWEPIVFAYGGTAAGGAVSGSGAVDVDVQGFEVDGRDRNPNGRGVGIFYRNAEGSISGNDVHSMGVGGRATMGILAYGASDVSIVDNEVSDYERGGIGVNGDGGAHPAPHAVIADNVVSTVVALGENAAPNGIQVGFGASGRIVGNEVTDNRWSGEGWSASCIIVFESDDVQVRDNYVSNCDSGVSLGAWGWFAPSADNVKIHGNTIENSTAGIVVRATAWQFSSMDPSVSNTKVVRNVLIGGDLGGTEDGIGLVVLATDAHEDFDPTADNNKLINNSISGFDTAILDEGMNSKNHANAIEP